MLDLDSLLDVPRREQRARPDTQGRRSAGQCCISWTAGEYLLISLSSFLALSPARARVGWRGLCAGAVAYEPRILRTLLCQICQTIAFRSDSHLAIVPDPPRTKPKQSLYFQVKDRSQSNVKESLKNYVVIDTIASYRSKRIAKQKGFCEASELPVHRRSSLWRSQCRFSSAKS